MKKIVGILAAAAVLATSVFAADVSAKVKLDGNLLSVDGTKEKDGLSAVMIQHNTDESWNPVINMSVSGDNYGASVGIYVGKWDATSMGGWNHGYGLGAKEWKIWIKPIDVLKFNIGRIDASLNTDSIDYDTRLYNYDEWGYQAELAINAFTLNLGFHMDQGQSWLWQELVDVKDANGNTLKDAFGNDIKEGKTHVRGLGLKAAYAADFGTIIALADFKDTFETIFVGAGYNNQFGDIRIFADAGFKTAKNYKIDGLKNQWGNVITETVNGKKVNKSVTLNDAFFVGGDFDIKYAKDAFGVEAYAKFEMLLSYKDRVADFNQEKENGTALFFKTKLTYAFDPCTVYFYFKDTNLLSSTFASTIKLGANGSVGAATWDICGQIETGKGGEKDAITAGNKVNFSIPVSFAVAF
ncbi:MAG: hypothetical protein K6A15_01135 [Treponema sp.]|nr:hypothetical protein [Treponema sp.]